MSWLCHIDSVYNLCVLVGGENRLNYVFDDYTCFSKDTTLRLFFWMTHHKLSLIPPTINEKHIICLLRIEVAKLVTCHPSGVKGKLSVVLVDC